MGWAEDWTNTEHVDATVMNARIRDKLGKLLVSANDTTGKTLSEKLVAGTNITLTENNDAGDETLTIAAASGGDPSRLSDGAVGAPAYSYSDDTDTGWYRSGVNQNSLAAGGSERIRVDSNTTIINPGGNSISPTSDADKLVVREGGISILRAAGNIHINAGDTADSDAGRLVYTTTDDWLFFTAGAERARLNATGLGVGTTDPDAKLHTVGDNIIGVDGEVADGDMDNSSVNFYLSSDEELIAAVKDSGGTVTDHNLSLPTVILQHKESNNTDGGTISSGAPRTRPLNTEVIDTHDLCTLSSDQFTLEPGTWLIWAKSGVFGVRRHQATLYNDTDTSVEIEGTSEYSRDTDDASNHSFIEGRFTITASKTFEIQHECETTASGNGFGISSSFGLHDEVYASVILIKVD